MDRNPTNGPFDGAGGENPPDGVWPVFIADDQPDVRLALRLLLEEQEDLTVAGEAAGAEELLGLVPEGRPAVLLVEWKLFGQRGREVVRSLAERSRAVVVALSGRPEVRRAAERAGVDAFISKSEPPERLLSEVRSAIARAGTGGPAD